MSSLNVSVMTKFLKAAALGTALAVAGGCAAVGVGVPGGGDSVNTDLFKDEKDFLTRMDKLKSVTGTDKVVTKTEVLNILGVKAKKLRNMDRSEIRGALEGTGPNAMPLVKSTLTADVLKCLQGSSFQYADDNGKYAFNNPIRWQKETKGFNYNVQMIFNTCSGKEPVVDTVLDSGGPTYSKRKKTVFDLINSDSFSLPGM